MQSVGFCTAISVPGDASVSLKILQAVDSYFYLGGRKALVISKEVKEQSQGALLYDSMSSLMGTCLKVISYCTLVIPALMLLAKFALRSFHKFHLIDVQEHLERGIEILQEANQQALSVLNGGEDDVVFYAKREDLLIFTLDTAPGLVFKTIPLGTTSISFDTSLEEQIESNQWLQICFNLLVKNRDQDLRKNTQTSCSNQTKLIEVANRFIIVEKQEAIKDEQEFLGEIDFAMARRLARIENDRSSQKSSNT